MDVAVDWAKNGNRGPNHDWLGSFGQAVDSPLFSITGKHNYISSSSLSGVDKSFYDSTASQSLPPAAKLAATRTTIN